MHKSICPECGAIWCATPPAKAGVITICIYCFTVLKYDKQLLLRIVTKEEFSFIVKKEHTNES